MTDRLRVLALEPYHGGSHEAVLDLLVEHVDAAWTVLALPARKWKWRMRGAAITMADELRSRERREPLGFDVVFASTFLNLAEWRGLVGPSLASVPAIVYFHENQLLYPTRHLAEWDFQFPLTNITSALSAERCAFNTRYNLDGFLERITGFLSQFPDHRPRGVVERIAERSVVIPPPFDDELFCGSRPVRGPRCRIVWPHRWEHDKDPHAFIDAVTRLAREGLDFEVAIAGQPFRETEPVVRSAAEALGERLVHCGRPRSREEYARLLASADVAVSTADNEFFGIAMIEACAAGCYPLVPDRLAYPEIYPAEMRYRDQEALVARLRSCINDRPPPGIARPIAERYGISVLAPVYADLLSEVAAGGRR